MAGPDPRSARDVTLAGRRRRAIAHRLVGLFDPRSDRPLARDDPPPYVCPFCGRGYDASRPRCGSCGGLPIVPREDRQVYRVVLGPCGTQGPP